MNSGSNVSTAIVLSFLVTFMEEIQEMNFSAKGKLFIVIAALVFVYLLLKENLVSIGSNNYIPQTDNLTSSKIQKKEKEKVIDTE